MKIRSIIAMAAVLAFSGMLCVHAEEEATTNAPPAKEKQELTKSVYVCPKCDMTALKAGKCSMCGADLVKMHLLGVKDGQAILCDCGAACECDFQGMKDGKCACGKEVKMASAKGLYSCPQGCPYLSEKPGKCLCGMEMKKAETAEETEDAE